MSRDALQTGAGAPALLTNDGSIDEGAIDEGRDYAIGFKGGFGRGNEGVPATELRGAGVEVTGAAVSTRHCAGQGWITIAEACNGRGGTKIAAIAKLVCELGFRHSQWICRLCEGILQALLEEEDTDICVFSNIAFWLKLSSIPRGYFGVFAFKLYLAKMQCGFLPLAHMN